MRSTPALWLAAILFPLSLSAQATDPWAALSLPRTHTPAPTTAAITAADLMTRLYLFADDSMQGRELGMRGNSRGVEYIASELKRLGLEPAGDNGTYFQTVPVVQRLVDSTVTLSVDGTPLKLWDDFIPRDQGLGTRPLDGTQVIFGGIWGDSLHLISQDVAEGKFVVLGINGSGFSNGVPGAANRPDVTRRFSTAAGIAIVGLDMMPPDFMPILKSVLPEMRPENTRPIPAFMYISRNAAIRLLGAPLEQFILGSHGRTVHGAIRFKDTPLAYPTRNVVAIVRGSDAKLRNEYVAIGAHNDHIGMLGSMVGEDGPPVPHDSIYVRNHLFRPNGADQLDPKLTPAQTRQMNDALAAIRKATGGKSARLDSVYNGADDDGSGSMGALELAEYFASAPVKPKRSLLFVWHVGEEEGLFGSEWFTDHPTVPRQSITAQLNIDMIGRGDATDATGMDRAGGQIHGNANYLQVIGAGRLSSELRTLVTTVNTSGKHGLVFDYALDADGHPQQIYCRSDHYEYARYGIPIAFFTTGGHADYHQLTDEPQYIDYPHMTRVVNYIADLAKHLADLDHRLVVDKPKPDPHALCRQ